MKAILWRFRDKVANREGAVGHGLEIGDKEEWMAHIIGWFTA